MSSKVQMSFIAQGEGPHILSCPTRERRARRNSAKQNQANKQEEIVKVETPEKRSPTPLATPPSYLDVCVQTQYFFELSRNSERAEGRRKATDAILNASFIWSPWESVKPSALLCGSSSLLA